MARYKLDQWKELIAEWQESGKTRKEFCQDLDVTVATFAYWRTKINKIDQPAAKETSGFVRCSLPSALPEGFSIEWPDGMKLHLPLGINFHKVADLIGAVRSVR